jgi:GalNAc-alpha-(1->4)-GalNAc-alpha-(1->3)-diNAcBac-PP-undecaprenol alpha-1,4-N-acetyl-D-galactosaminyltransferase
MGKNQTIMLFSGSMGKGGAERVLSILANSLVQKKWNVIIVLLLDNRIEYLLDDSVQIINLSRPKAKRIFNIWHWIKNIRKTIRSLKPDAIISFFARNKMK